MNVCTHVQGEEGCRWWFTFHCLSVFELLSVCRFKELAPFFQQTPLVHTEKCNHSSSGLRFVDTHISRDFDVFKMHFYFGADKKRMVDGGGTQV
jgi:hypothetical protein